MKYTLIQALRGLLCVGVVFMHIKMALMGLFPIPSLKGDPSFFAYLPDILGGIPCGFFAVSGYFMAFLVDRETPYFLSQRLVRVYPTFLIAVCLAFLLRAFTTSLLNFDNLFPVLSLLPFGMGKSYKLGIEWTLVYEVSYYFVCAFFCRPKWSKRFPAFLLAWLFALIAMDTFHGSSTAGFTPPLPLPTIFSLWGSIWNYSFIMGALTFYYLQRRQEPATLAWTGQVLLATTCAVSVLNLQGYGVLYLLGLLSCVLLDLLIRLEKRVRAPKILAQLGDYSYALYLIHPTIIILVLDRWHAITGQPPGLVAGLMATVLCFGAFWYLGQIDVAVHKRCKVLVNRILTGGLPLFLRGFIPKPVVAAVPLERDKP
jgi:peptidoglycan/LPS O-acetylase OafA/YrhL